MAFFHRVRMCGETPTRRALASAPPSPASGRGKTSARSAPSPACGGGLGWGCCGIDSVSSRARSPSLPRRNDLDLVAVLDRRLGPAAFRQHVEIQRDRKMAAFVFELAE